MTTSRSKYIFSNGASLGEIYGIDPQDIGGSIQLTDYLFGEIDEFKFKPKKTDKIGLTKYYIYNGDLNSLIKLHESGKAVYDSEIFNYAAQYGYIDMVKWLHINSPVPFTVNAIDRAVEGGHLDVVKFLCENRNEGFTKHAFITAVKHKRQDIISYLYDFLYSTSKFKCT